MGGVVVEINGKILPIGLKRRIELNQSSFNYGELKKLEVYLNILNKFNSLKQ